MSGFVLPPYPYDRLDPLKAIAAAHDGGIVDLSVGTPTDPPPQAVLDAIAASDAERGYPPSVGTPSLRAAAQRWLRRRFGVEVDAGAIAATIGSKEFVAGLPHWLRLRTPERDTVLYPAVSYPSYAMGAALAGCRAVPVTAAADGTIDLSAVDPADARRALCLWVNTPSNPGGGLDDLDAAAAWGRANEVVVASDECYAEFTWDGPPRTILSSGTEGVLALHSLSKRSNLAGVRVGVYAGDADIVRFVSEVRKHAGFMCPGPSQAAAVAAFDDQAHVDVQRDRYLGRLRRMRDLLAEVGVDADLPSGGFYLFPEAPDGDAWAFAELLARRLGVLVSPGEFYGEAGASRVRVAVVRPDEAYDLVEERLGQTAGE
ncbi:MAG: aminotransferase class I/II-fold pyridoxal phosphate-dependent enzyme [Actinomycetota bacterium]